MSLLTVRLELIMLNDCFVVVVEYWKFLIFPLRGGFQGSEANTWTCPNSAGWLFSTSNTVTPSTMTWKTYWKVQRYE